MRPMLRALAVVAGVVLALGLSAATASAELTDLWVINVETGKCMTSDQQIEPASVFQHKCGEPSDRTRPTTACLFAL